MSGRSLLIPILVICMFAAPIIYHQHKESESEQTTQWNSFESTSFDAVSNIPGKRSNFSLPSQQSPISPFSSGKRDTPSFNQFAQSPQATPTTHPSFASFRGETDRNDRLKHMEDSYSKSFGYQQYGPQTSHSHEQPSGFMRGENVLLNPIVQPPNLNIDFSSVGAHHGTGMNPDIGMVQTLILPGNEFGPDFTAAPLENIPVWDFREIFRFDITQEWVRQRWKRVSTVPSERNLAGMRVALVTGTQSWDLHGSLTYYFDNHQQLQRITFKGWTGDPQKLIQTVTSDFQFEAQPSRLAGFYMARHRRKISGGLMMKYPPVLNSDFPHQQLGIVMEINRPGVGELSQEFNLLIQGSHPER